MLELWYQSLCWPRWSTTSLSCYWIANTILWDCQDMFKQHTLAMFWSIVVIVCNPLYSHSIFNLPIPNMYLCWLYHPSMPTKITYRQWYKLGYKIYEHVDSPSGILAILKSVFAVGYSQRHINFSIQTSTILLSRNRCRYCVYAAYRTATDILTVTPWKYWSKVHIGNGMMLCICCKITANWPSHARRTAEFTDIRWHAINHS